MISFEKVCKNFISKGYCSFGMHCNLTHMNSNQLCKNYFRKGFCSFFPNCKFIHIKNSSHEFLLHSSCPLFQFNSQSFSKKIYENINELFEENIIFNYVFNKEKSLNLTINAALPFEIVNFSFDDQVLIDFYNLKYGKLYKNFAKIELLNLNLNSNCMNDFSYWYRLFRFLLKNMVCVKKMNINLINFVMGNNLIQELTEFISKINGLESIRFIFHNFCLTNDIDRHKYLNKLAQKLKNIKEFHFIINNDYEKHSNLSYQVFLSSIINVLANKEFSKLKIITLQLGCSNFDFLDFQMRLDMNEIFFNHLQEFNLCLPNSTDFKQLKSFSNFIPYIDRDLIKFRIFFYSKTDEIIDFSTVKDLEILKQFNNLKLLSINFSDSLIKNIDSIDLFTNYFLPNQNIENLQWDGSNLVAQNKNRSNISNSLLNLLSSNPKLKSIHLKLSNMNLYNKEFINLMRKIECPDLEEFYLDVEYNKIGNESLNELSITIEKMKNLRILSLNLSKNRIRQEGMKSLGESINKLENLIEIYLDVSFNTILNDGFVFIMNNITRNLKVLKFICDRNGISKDAMINFKEIIAQKFRFIREIFLCLNINETIGDEGNTKLIQSFEELAFTNKSLVNAKFETDLSEKNANLKNRIDNVSEFLKIKKIHCYRVKLLHSSGLRKYFRREICNLIANNMCVKTI